MTLELLIAVGAQISPSIARAMARDSSASRAEVAAALEHAKPSVLAGFARLGATPGGACRLLEAATVAYRSDLLDKLRSFGPEDAAALASRGRSILKAIFGIRTRDVIGAVARASGARPEIAGRALASVAPIALAVLGRQATTRSLDPLRLSRLLATDERTILALAPPALGPTIGDPAPSAPRPRRGSRRPPHHLPRTPWALFGVIVVAIAVLGVDWAGTRVTSRDLGAIAAVAPAPAPAPAATRDPSPPAGAPPAEPTSQTTITAAEMPLTAPPLYEIHFGYDSTQIAGEDAVAVREIASALIHEPKLQPKTQIRLTGHGDGVASADAEKQLGLERAASVRHRLVQLGVDPARVEITAAAQPAGPEGVRAPATGAEDRRVDVSLVNE